MLTDSQATALAKALDIDIDYPGMCSACLGIVAAALDCGDEREVARAARMMTPDLWADGLRPYALAAVRRARARGTPHADDALVELEAKGGRSRVARAIVRELAQKLSERVSKETLVDLVPARVRLTAPELN